MNKPEKRTLKNDYKKNDRNAPGNIFRKSHNYTERSAPEYHSSRWTKESRAFREANPLCYVCYEKGYLVAAEATDHKVPFPICSDFWDQSNWGAICTKCNREKGIQDKKLFSNFKKNKHNEKTKNKT